MPWLGGAGGVNDAYLTKKWNVRRRTGIFSRHRPPSPHPGKGSGAAVAVYLGEKQMCLENER